MTPGLYQDLDRTRQAHAKFATLAVDQDAAPQIRHAAEVGVEKSVRTIESIESAILENVDMASEIQGQINRLTISKHQSRHRSLVITLLENAQDRLRRELGDTPAN